MAKRHQLPYSRPSSVSHQLIFSNLWGHALIFLVTRTIILVLSMILENSREFIWSDIILKFLISFIKSKNLLNVALEENHHHAIWLGRKIWVIKFLFKKIGITHHVSCSHDNKQNRSTERKHHHHYRRWRLTHCASLHSLKILGWSLIAPIFDKIVSPPNYLSFFHPTRNFWRSFTILCLYVHLWMCMISKPSPI